MKQVVKAFLNSDSTETAFFDSSKENLIILKDYLESLLSKDNEFQNTINEPLESIRDKCAWVEGVGFNGFQLSGSGEYFHSGVNIFAKDNVDLVVTSKDNIKNYKEVSLYIPKIYRASSKVRTLINRQGDLDKIQDELKEIGKIGCEIYDGALYPRESVSGMFETLYRPNIGLDIWSDDDLVAGIYERPTKCYNKPYLSGKNACKVLTKIQLKSNNRKD